VSKTKKVNKLSDLSIDEVSLVDRGANQHAKLVLSKRLEDEDLEELHKADPDPSAVSLGHEDDEDDDDEDDDVEKGFFSSLVEKMFGSGELTTPETNTGTLPYMSDVEKAFPGQDPRQGMFGGQQPPPQQPPMQAPPMQMGVPAAGPQNFMPGQQGFPVGPDGLPAQMEAGPPLPDEVIQYIQQLEQALADAQGENTPSGDQEDDNVNPFGKSYDMLDDDETAFLAELAKNLETEEQRDNVAKAMEIVEKANARAEAAEEIAKAERDFRLNQEFVAKARSYSNLPVNPEEFGPVLKKLNEVLNEDELGLVTKVFSSANETVAHAGVFTEIGKRGVGSYETVSKVDGKAHEIAKSEGITIEAARERVFEQDPSLYDQYLQESGR
jgi:hypothetical protein